MGKIDDKIEHEPTLNDLVETGLFVEDLARASAFFEAVLGLRKVKTSETGCVFRVADQRYLLLFSRQAADTPNKTSKGDVLPPCALPQHNGRGPGHIAFGVSADALDLWRARLAKHNVDVLSEIAWESGARSLYFRDPDGHLLELASAGIWEPV
jgi:catechol 2,3-dioxygenase-like lactoylglutathione lyase family enzyme